jgi:hypothetical protein
VALPVSTDARVQAFFAYWNSLAKDGGLPRLPDYLNRAPHDLQPTVAIVDVYTPTDLRVRLFGTALVDLIATELTGKAALSIYAPESHRTASAMAWRAVSQPCGYLCKRTFRSFSGTIITAPGIALPVRTDRSDCKTVINFTNLDQATSTLGLGHARFDMVQALERVAWIDLGFGVPS